MLFISHDLGIVRYLADRVMVMYLGHVVEIGTTDQVFEPPYHPYTEALLSAVPIADTRVMKAHIVLEGDIPSAVNPPPGCPFQTRCPRKHQVPGNLCETELPPLRELAPGHQRPLPPAGGGLRHDAAGDPGSRLTRCRPALDGLAAAAAGWRKRRVGRARAAALRPRRADTERRPHRLRPPGRPSRRRRGRRRSRARW